jgi:hypothetical protein
MALGCFTGPSGYMGWRASTTTLFYKGLLATVQFLFPVSKIISSIMRCLLSFVVLFFSLFLFLFRSDQMMVKSFLMDFLSQILKQVVSNWNVWELLEA